VTTPTLPGDAFDPNNTLATAHNFGVVSSINQSSLTIDSSTETDFFAFTPRKNGTYTISISFTNANGNLDLAVFNAQGQQLAVANSTTAYGQTITLSLSANQQYYIEVWSPVGAVNTYSLAVALASSGTTGGGTTGNGGHHH
jgi:hypothetical protein